MAIPTFDRVRYFVVHANSRAQAVDIADALGWPTDESLRWTGGGHVGELYDVALDRVTADAMRWFAANDVGRVRLPACCSAPADASLAQRLYAAYNAGGDAATAGLNYQGAPCPTWGELPPNVRAKWEAAARAATP